MLMADVMLDNWAVIEQALRKAGASQDQIADALDAYQAICWRWVRTNSVARAFEEKVQNEAPTVYTRCARPAGLMDDIMRYELESWPDEWDEYPVEREAE